MTSSDPRRAVERLLEDERLTANLVDEAAARLLEWATARAEALAQPTAPAAPSTCDDPIADIRRTMRRVNREAGQLPPSDQAAYVQARLAQIEPGPGEPATGAEDTDEA